MKIQNLNCSFFKHSKIGIDTVEVKFGNCSKNMTIKEATERVDEIRNDIKKWGGPAAHLGEDNLYGDFVRAIVNNQCEDVDKIAGIIIVTQDMEFDRWYE